MIAPVPVHCFSITLCSHTTTKIVKETLSKNHCLCILSNYLGVVFTRMMVLSEHYPSKPVKTYHIFHAKIVKKMSNVFSMFTLANLRLSSLIFAISSRHKEDENSTETDTDASKYRESSTALKRSVVSNITGGLNQFVSLLLPNLKVSVKQSF